jgi:hypothetical protein
MNGGVYGFETRAPYHPLKSWSSAVQGPNGLLARHDLVGVYATESARRPRDVAGQTLQVCVLCVLRSKALCGVAI